MLTDKQYKGWSIQAIAWFAIKHKIVTACVSTWYKYIKILNIQRTSAKSRRKNHDIGIRAASPHKLWHMDVTIFKTQDNIKAYIHILMDNNSRAILGFRISLKLKAANTVSLLKEANDKYILPNSAKLQEVTLLTDGGSENQAAEVEDFTDSSDNIIRKLRSLVDVTFSNSMVEAYNKILKYGFLYHKELPDFVALKNYLPKAIKEYNEIRPHHAHKYLTPTEVLNGQQIQQDKFKQEFKQAMIKRNKEHQNPECGVCV
jgi:putative transposase